MVRCVSSSYVFWYPICPPSSKDFGVLTKWANPSPLRPSLHLHSKSLVPNRAELGTVLKSGQAELVRGLARQKNVCQNFSKSKPPAGKNIFFSNSDFPTIQKWSPTLTDHFWFFGWEVKFFAQISLSRDPLQGKNIFFSISAMPSIQKWSPTLTDHFWFFRRNFFLCTPGGTTGRELGTNPRRIFSLALFFSYFSISDRMTLVSSKSEHFENRRQNWGGSSKPHPCPKKFFWVKKKALIETRILVPHMPT